MYDTKTLTNDDNKLFCAYVVRFDSCVSVFFYHLFTNTYNINWFLFKFSSSKLWYWLSVGFALSDFVQILFFFKFGLTWQFSYMYIFTRMVKSWKRNSLQSYTTTTFRRGETCIPMPCHIGIQISICLKNSCNMFLVCLRHVFTNDDDSILVVLLCVCVCVWSIIIMMMMMEKRRSNVCFAHTQFYAIIL